MSVDSFRGILTHVVLPRGAGGALGPGGHPVLLLGVKDLFVQVHQQVFGKHVLPGVVVGGLVTFAIQAKLRPGSLVLF